MVDSTNLKTKINLNPRCWYAGALPSPGAGAALSFLGPLAARTRSLLLSPESSTESEAGGPQILLADYPQCYDWFQLHFPALGGPPLRKCSGGLLTLREMQSKTAISMQPHSCKHSCLGQAPWHAYSEHRVLRGGPGACLRPSAPPAAGTHMSCCCCRAEAPRPPLPHQPPRPLCPKCGALWTHPLGGVPVHRSAEAPRPPLPHQSPRPLCPNCPKCGAAWICPLGRLPVHRSARGGQRPGLPHRSSPGPREVPLGAPPGRGLEPGPDAGRNVKCGMHVGWVGHVLWGTMCS